MATTGLIRFYFRTLHPGAEGNAVEQIYDFLHSDTVFSAFCHGWLRVFGKQSLEDLLKEFPKGEAVHPPVHEPPFRISSAFPFVEREDILTYFLPKPFKRPPVPPLDEEQFQGAVAQKALAEARRYAKALADADWIELGFFQEWAAHDQTIVRPEDRDPIAWQEKQQALSDMDSLLSGAMRKGVLPRNIKDRLTGTTQYYLCRVIHFADVLKTERAGLYILVQYRDDIIKAQLQQVIAFLEDDGIGGERTGGCGAFRSCWEDSLGPEWTIAESVLEAENRKIAHMTLSLYQPAGYEQPIIFRPTLEQYAFVPRAGWVSSPLSPGASRRRVIHLLKEGSLLRVPQDPLAIPSTVRGGLVDVTPPGFTLHKVYRYALAFTLPVVATRT